MLELTEQFDHLLAIILTAKLQIDKHEADDAGIAVAIGVVLDAVGYDPVVSLAASSQTAHSLREEFSKKYFRCENAVQETLVFWAACKTAMFTIKEGKINERFRLAAVRALAESQSQSDDAGPDQPVL